MRWAEFCGFFRMIGLQLASRSIARERERERERDRERAREREREREREKERACTREYTGALTPCACAYARSGANTWL